jgi:excinuclease ABC subunit C
MQIVEGMGVTGIYFVSLAKRQEEVFLPHNSKSILLPRESSALFLIQRIRDEAHRFAITYHRKLRSKSAISDNK